MDDLKDLAELSHRVRSSALALAAAGLDVRLIAHELEAQARDQREAVALALSYLLRTRSLDGAADRSVADAIDAVALTLRRMP